MNDRQRFLATMHYQPRDRAPICDFGFWHETIPTWHQQGLPQDVYWRGDGNQNTDWFFGMDQYRCGPAANAGLCPGFKAKVLEDRGDHELLQQADGVRVLRHKHMSSIPQHEGHLLVDRASWEKYYKPRLDPDEPARYPADWDAAVRIWTDPQRSYPVALGGGSLFGKIRDWMGLEAVSYVPFDDPAWFEDMVTTVADCSYGVLKRQFEAGAQVEAINFWEDMAFASGPLLSPELFKRYLVPHYRRLTDLARQYGCDIAWVDCDGKIDALIPLWLDAGVNCMFPVEIGTWGADPVAMRRQYGRDLLMMGGFDKRLLAKGPAAIDAEVARLTPLVDDGGCIPFCDHRVPPDVPLENYLHYLRRAREAWGQNVNLKPMHA